MKLPTLFAIQFLFGALAFADTPDELEREYVEIVERTFDFHFDGIDVASDGYLYCPGSWKGNQVFRSTSDGQSEEFATGFEGATDSVMDSKGNLFVSNYNSNYISKITPDRVVSKFVETPQGPAGMAIDSADNLFVTVYGRISSPDTKVLKITPSAEVSTYVDDPVLTGSVGLAIDDHGALFVSSGRDGRIFRIPSEGQLELFSCLPLAFGKGAGAHLDWGGGRLFAASGIGAVYTFSPEGAIHYLLQDGTEQSAEGPPVSPLVQGCNGLAVSADGNTLFLGTAPFGKRALVRVNLSSIAPGTTPKHAWGALNAGRFDLAERMFTKLSKAEQVLPTVWFGLGSLAYRKREFRDAGNLFRRAADGPQLRPNAAYNAACSFSLAGETDTALETLKVALEAGFNDYANLKTDSDFDPIRSHSGWAEIRKIVEQASREK